MTNISIVTAFYDIGRTNWKSYERSTEEYFRCFKLLCQLKNKIVVFTQSKFKKEFELIKNTIKEDLIVFYNDEVINNSFYIDKINQVQKDPQYLSGILTPDCPEYWNPYYVYVNFLKSQFCVKAIEKGLDLEELVAWIDFGYVKKQEQIPKSKIWNYNFEDKIHFWSIKDIPKKIDIIHTIKTNTVYIQGCHIVAPKSKWFILNSLMNTQLNFLLSHNLVDDDQTLLLMSYISNSKEFKIHHEDINYQDLGWFFIFQHYNDRCNNEYFLKMENIKK